MSFYPILSAPGCTGLTTLYNFPPNNWEDMRKERRLVNLTWAQDGAWRSVTLGELAFGEMQAYIRADLAAHVPEDALPLASTPFPERSESLPTGMHGTNMPNWCATLGLVSPLASTCYQGELDPFPVPGSLLTFAPFMQFGVGIENYMVLLNLEKSAQARTSTVEIYDSAVPGRYYGSFEVRNNAVSDVSLDDTGMGAADLPVITCKGMSGIPLYFSKTTDGAFLSLEHTHPPASYVIHGKRWEAQKILKNDWFAKLGANMKHYIERLRRATWTYKQPLTRVPDIAGASVSDLFVWRNSEEWKTFFELMDLPALFTGPDSAGGHVTLVLFDAAGQLLLEKTVEIKPGRRQTLSLFEIIGSGFGSVGTFSLFHAHPPKCLQVLGSHLAERGYVSYRYRCAPLRAYVHGNLDEIARLPDQRLQLLGGQSIRCREYHLQHALDTQGYYELGIVNPTPKKQRVVCRTLFANGKLMDLQSVDLAPRGSHLFRVTPQHTQQRIVISSRFVMARPLVFRIQNQTMDVFHG